MDLVSAVVRIPTIGETVNALSFNTYPGGKGANQAVAVARLNHPVQMIGMTGTDAFGDSLRSTLAKNGVDVTHVGSAEGVTGTACIFVSELGENCIAVNAGANRWLTPEMLLSKADVITRAGVVLTQLEIPIETVECLAELCRNRGVPLILDPAPTQTLSPATLSSITWFTPNEAEVLFYAHQWRSDTELLERLFSLGMQGVVLKRGDKGALIAERGSRPVAVATPSVRVLDTTAAGDAFNGAFAVGLMRGFGPERGTYFANTAASISVTRSGAQPSLATLAEVEAMQHSIALNQD